MIKIVIPDCYLNRALEEVLKLGVYEIFFADREYYKYVGSTAKLNKGRDKSTCGFKSRWHRHLKDLRDNEHCNANLQRVFNKKGINR